MANRHTSRGITARRAKTRSAAWQRESTPCLRDVHLLNGNEPAEYKEETCNRNKRTKTLQHAGKAAARSWRTKLKQVSLQNDEIPRRARVPHTCVTTAINERICNAEQRRLTRIQHPNTAERLVQSRNNAATKLQSQRAAL